MHRVAIHVPQDWVHLDLSPEGEAKFRQAVERIPGLRAAEVAQATQSMRSVRAAARKENAVIAAVWARPHAEHLVLAASLVVAVRPYWRPPGDSAKIPSDSLEPIVTSLQAAPDLIQLGRVELPGGNAVRAVRRQQGEREADPGSITLQYYVPVVGDRPDGDRDQPNAVRRPSGVVVAAFTTPVSPLVDRFLELFSQLASTLRVEVTASAG